MVSVRRPRPARRTGGFTYLGLMVLVTIIGLVGAAALKVDGLLERAAKERELLEMGAAFSAALKSYAETTPRGQPTFPPTLKELLRDPRVPGLRRHLRKIFVDPMTGKAEWGIVWANPDSKKGVLAVYSLARAKPLKQSNFDARFQGLERKEHLSDWKFAATGQSVVQPQGAQQAGQAKPPGMPQPAGQGDAPAAPASLFPAQGAQPQVAPTETPKPPPPEEPPEPAAGEPAADAPAPAESSPEPPAEGTTSPGA